MRRLVLQIGISLILGSLGFVTVSAQAETSSPVGRQTQQREEVPKNIRETMAKQRIEQEKKDFEELLKRSEEAVAISDELEKTFEKSQQLSSADQKKLDRLEKLVKKIRSELGADGDDDPDETRKSEAADTGLKTAFKSLQSRTVQLFQEIKKSTRYSVSVAAIQTSNALLRLLKIIRIRN